MSYDEKRKRHYVSRQFVVWILHISFWGSGLITLPVGAQETNGVSWHFNTSVLDDLTKYGRPAAKTAGSTLAHDVKRFYQLLRDKQWQETYELHAKAFREVVSEVYYTTTAKLEAQPWELVSYEVLSCQLRNALGSTNIDEAALICKFAELPYYAETYSTVFWHKEDGVWKCLSAGPHKLSIFNEVKVPFIDWR
jgi:hypothetical protein